MWEKFDTVLRGWVAKNHRKLAEWGHGPDDWDKLSKELYEKCNSHAKKKTNSAELVIELKMWEDKWSIPMNKFAFTELLSKFEAANSLPSGENNNDSLTLLLDKFKKEHTFLSTGERLFLNTFVLWAQQQQAGV